MLSTRIKVKLILGRVTGLLIFACALKNKVAQIRPSLPSAFQIMSHLRREKKKRQEMDFVSPWCNTVARSPLQFYHCHSDSDSVPLWVLGHQACHAATCRSAVNMCEGLTRGNLSSTRVSVTVSCLLPFAAPHPLVSIRAVFVLQWE